MPLLSKARLMTQPRERSREVREFQYQGIGGASTTGAAGIAASAPGVQPLWSAALEDPEPASHGPSEEEIRAREQRAWQKGFEEALATSRENLEKSLAADRVEVTRALQEFALGREEYYRRLEGEVVQLALAVTRKVLHREAQMDPLLLTGVVRVALEKIAGGAAVKVRVPPEQADSWRVALRKMPPRDLAVEIVADDALRGPRCLIVTEMGSTDVSLDAQLAEIERGFVDLLKERPASHAS